MTTMTNEVADETIGREFPEDDLDSLCIGAKLVETIATALGMEPFETDDGILAPSECEPWLNEAGQVLAALIDAGFVKRSDYRYDEKTHSAVHVDAPPNYVAMKEIDNQSGTAAYLGVPPRTLEDWRYRGIGPRFIRMGERAVRYRRADVDAWLAAQTVYPG